MRRRLPVLCICLVLLLPAPGSLLAQSPADSTAIAEAFVRAITPRIKAKLDRGEAVVFNTWKQPWDLEVERSLREELDLPQDPESTPWDAVHFRSGGFHVRSDSAYVEAIFSRCEPGDHMLDWHGTYSIYVFASRQESWSYVRWFYGSVSDGQCPYEKPDAD